jgi:protein-S-isoprenylcysteine O-methyltransferase Ste14
MADRPPLSVLVLRAMLALAFETALLTWGLGGLAALLASPRALALVAVWGVTGVTLSVSRPARSRDTARAERDPLALAVLALVPLAIPGVAALGGRLGAWPLPLPEVVGWTGVALSALGLWIRVSAMRQLGPRFSPLVALQREHALETTGWYARVRHPGYLGALLASLGASVVFGSALALPLLALMFVFQWGRVRREETLLAAHFGEAWRAYAARTGALWPGPGGSTPTARRP